VKSLFFLLRLLLFGLLLFFSEPLSYFMHLAQGNLNLMVSSKPSESLPLTYKENFGLVQDALSFAKDSLGLDPGEAYQTYLHHESPLLHVVSGSKAFALERLEWNYPFLGSLGYKGFFYLHEAEREAELWKEKGFSVAIRPVNAWSTLGFLPDPVTTYMLNKEPGVLYEILFHEITHRHVYVPGRDAFNENLAQHVGQEAAKRYLLFLGDSVYLATYQAHLHTQCIKQVFMDFLVQKTKGFYAFLQGWKKSKLQAVMLRKMWFYFWYAKTKCYPGLGGMEWLKEADQANARLVVYLQYHQDAGKFAHELNSQFNGDLRKQIASFIETYGR
jgi:predicted aminopeptidase